MTDSRFKLKKGRYPENVTQLPVLSHLKFFSNSSRVSLAYIMLNLNRYIRYTLTRFRFGVSDIKVHRSKFKLYNVDELKCPLCLLAVENEVHFVLCCPAFEDLRYEFIESKYFNNPYEFRLAQLLATQNERALKNLALFLYKAFSRRKTLVS